MEEAKKAKLDALAAKMKDGSISGSEKEEHRLLNMEYLAEIVQMNQLDDDEEE